MKDEQSPAPEVEQGTDPDRRMRYFWRVAGLILVLLIAGTIYRQFTSIPLRISKKTTHITEPLTPDGKHVDYFAAIEQEAYPEDMATEKNGYRLIIEHLGMPQDCSLEEYKRMRQKLGLSATNAQPDMTFQSPHGAVEEYVGSDNFDEELVRKLLVPDTPAETASESSSSMGPAKDHIRQHGGEDEWYVEGSDIPADDIMSDPVDVTFALADRLYAPWTLNELPMMEQWIKTTGPALDLLNRAVCKPVFAVPLVPNSDNDTLYEALSLSQLQQMRSFARALSVRAHYHIGTGQIDKAIDDILTCKRLGRAVGRGPILVGWLVGIAIEGIADAIGVGDSLKHPPTKEQLQRLLRQTNGLPPRATLEEVMHFERYFLLDGLQRLSEGKESFEHVLDAHPVVKRCIETVGVDWNVIARRLNHHFDRFLATGREPPEPSIKSLHVLSIPGRSKMVADMLGRSLLPSYEAAREAARRSRCVERLKRITLAMLIYEREHGTLPPAYSVDEDGEPLHSWRVLLLPYLGHQDLYENIRLDEPWDSAHNRKFHDMNVLFYRCPTAELPPGHTSYSVVIGRHTAFGGSRGRSLDAFGPRRKHLILVVERVDDYCWMDPTKELSEKVAKKGINCNELDAAKAGAATPRGVDSGHPGGANVGLREGAGEFVSENIDLEHWKELLEGSSEPVD
ncbi:MAG: DUF1559 domain-containing protein [Pirellulaceae bacterium]